MLPPRLSHITSTSDAENMKLPKQDYAAQPGTQPGLVAPGKQLSKRTLLRKLENNKDSSNRSVMTFCHLYYFLGGYESRQAEIGKTNIFRAENTERAGINMTVMNLPDIQDRRRSRRRGLDGLVFILLPNFLLIPAAAQPYLFVPANTVSPGRLFSLQSTHSQSSLLTNLSRCQSMPVNARQCHNIPAQNIATIEVFLM